MMSTNSFKNTQRQNTGVMHISVVSHGQASLVAQLLKDIKRFCGDTTLRVTVTINIQEVLGFDPGQYPFAIELIHNSRPKGFSENHNTAFRYSAERNTDKWFCVMNPDVRLTQNVFPALMDTLGNGSNTGVVAPLVRNQHGVTEDSARRFPRIVTPLLRALGRSSGPDYLESKVPFEPDWVAGMFMLFPVPVWKAIGGFDERYFLYYEDVDLCARLRLSGYRVVVDPRVFVIHKARRDSHRNIRYLRWHIRSAARFFGSSVYRRISSRVAN